MNREARADRAAKFIELIRSAPLFMRVAPPPLFCGRPCVTSSQPQSALTDQWGDAELALENQLYMQLADASEIHAFDTATEIANHFRETVRTTIDAKWATSGRGEMPEWIRDSARYDLMLCCLEYAFRDQVQLPQVGDLFGVYSAGWTPHGWDGKWPQGALCVG